MEICKHFLVLLITFGWLPRLSSATLALALVLPLAFTSAPVLASETSTSEAVAPCYFTTMPIAITATVLSLRLRLSLRRTVESKLAQPVRIRIIR